MPLLLLIEFICGKFVCIPITQCGKKNYEFIKKSLKKRMVDICSSNMDGKRPILQAMNYINHTHVKLHRTFGIFPIHKSPDFLLCFLQKKITSSGNFCTRGKKLHWFACSL